MEHDNSMERVYSASDIQIFEPREAVRRRPGMYVGALDQRALTVLINDAVDSLLRTYAILKETPGTLTIRLESDESATISCEGPALSTMFLEQCAPFLLKEFQMGMIRTCLLPVNALSARLNLTVRTAPDQWRTFLFEQGLLRSDESHYVAPSPNCHIWLRFWPDFTILAPASFDLLHIQETLLASFPSMQEQITLLDARS